MIFNSSPRNKHVFNCRSRYINTTSTTDQICIVEINLFHKEGQIFPGYFDIFLGKC